MSDLSIPEGLGQASFKVRIQRVDAPDALPHWIMIGWDNPRNLSGALSSSPNLVLFASRDNIRINEDMNFLATPGAGSRVTLLLITDISVDAELTYQFGTSTTRTQHDTGHGGSLSIEQGKIVSEVAMSPVQEEFTAANSSAEVFAIGKVVGNAAGTWQYTAEYHFGNGKTFLEPVRGNAGPLGDRVKQIPGTPRISLCGSGASPSLVFKDVQLIGTELYPSHFNLADDFVQTIGLSC